MWSFHLRVVLVGTSHMNALASWPHIVEYIATGKFRNHVMSLTIRATTVIELKSI